MEYQTSIDDTIQLFDDQPLSYERSFVPRSLIPDEDNRQYMEHIACLPDIVRELTPRIRRALEWAAYAHQNQKRYVARESHNGGYEFPHYIEHPYIVAAIVAQVTDDEDVIIAAILHDVEEDQPDRMNLDMIEREFGPRVRRIVRDVTKDNGNPDKAARNANYLTHIRYHACEEARVVCMADKIHNIMSDLDDYESIGEDLWRLFTKPGQTVEKTKQRKFAWFDGAYQIMLETMPLHPLTHTLGDMVRAYQKISIDTIVLSPSETRV